MTRRATFASSRIITNASIFSPSEIRLHGNRLYQPCGSCTWIRLEHTFCIDSTTLDVVIAREVASGVENAGARMIDAQYLEVPNYPNSISNSIVPITCM